MTEFTHGLTAAICAGLAVWYAIEGPTFLASIWTFSAVLNGYAAVR